MEVRRMPSPPLTQHRRAIQERLGAEGGVDDDESGSCSGTESSSSVGEEAAELLANCLSSPDPTDITEGLKALEALVTRHPESAPRMEELNVPESALRLARLHLSSGQTMMIDPIQNYAVLLLCALACASEESRMFLRERACPGRLVGLLDRTRPNGPDTYAGKLDVAVIAMILLRQLARTPEYRKGFPEKELLATVLADHAAGARDEEALMHSMDLIQSFCFANKGAQLAFDKAKGVGSLLRHVGAAERVAVASLKTLMAVLTDNQRVQASNYLQVFPLLCPLLRDDHTPMALLVAATMALGACCDADSGAKRKIVSDGMLEVIVHLVEQRTDELREAGLSALRCFTRTVRVAVLSPGASEWRTLVRQHGALLPMAAMIGAPHLGTRTQALGGLLEAIKDHKENTKLVHGIVLQHAPVLWASLAPTADVNLQYYTLGVLCSVCYKKSAVRSLSAVHGLKERIFSLMTSDNEIVRVAANYTARFFM